jgi:hypothetical protein
MKRFPSFSSEGVFYPPISQRSKCVRNVAIQGACIQRLP